MEPVALKDIQGIGLGILVKIHDFCVSHHIKYSISYGTLIGAVRHHGFIPWDDDIDIMMLRADYDRFLASFEYPGLAVLSQYDPHCYQFFSRIYDTEQTYSIIRFPFCKSYSGGIWVDVLPIDYVEDDFLAFRNKYNLASFLFQKQMQCREPKMSFSSMPTLKKKAGLLMRKIIRRGGRDIASVKAELYNLSISVPAGSSSHLSCLAYIDLPADRNFFLSEDFEEMVFLEFEGFQFCAIKGYDRFLSIVFGDYMQFPPEEKRNPTHVNMFFWR